MALLMKGIVPRVGEMVQWLQVHTALLEDPDSVASTHMATKKSSVTPVPGDPMASWGFHGHDACI